MIRRPARYDANLPKNLTYRKKYKSYYWRNPLTGKEIALGIIARRDAIAQAIEANHYIEQNYSPVLLLDRLKGGDQLTLTRWLKRYAVIFERRKLAGNTYKVRKGQIATIEEEMGGMILAEITTKHVAEFLENWVVQGKASMAATMRSVLSDIFREAIVEGHITVNPVAPTRAAKITVKRERLELDQYTAIRKASDELPRWFALAMDLALITGQRREDVASMRFDQVVNDRLQIVQGKTGTMLSLPLDLELQSLNLKLREVITQCRRASSTAFMLSTGIRKNSPDGCLNADSLTKKFVAARNLSGLTFEESPPTFHEIRSLSGRLYERERGKEFARKLMGHKSEKMTDKYLDTRGKEYSIV